MSPAVKGIVDHILLDGSILEGGGQIIRNAIALASLTHQPISITNIRANRSPPGLKAQHSAGIKLVADISNAHTNGIDKGSHFIDTFESKCIRAGDYVCDIGTAGSTALLFQSSLPCLLFPEVDGIELSSSSIRRDSGERCRSRLSLVGGTNGLLAPQIDYIQKYPSPFIKKTFSTKWCLIRTFNGFE